MSGCGHAFRLTLAREPRGSRSSRRCAAMSSGRWRDFAARPELTAIGLLGASQLPVGGLSRAEAGVIDGGGAGTLQYRQLHYTRVEGSEDHGT
jgi:hypothetical protein